MHLNNLSIDYMNIKDLENIKDTLEIDFDNFWNYNIFKSEIENPNSTYFVIKQNDTIIGFAGILVVIDEADITNIVIKKSFRGIGISNILIKKIIDFCIEKNLKKINLEVNSNNIIAINLYKKWEFKQVGCRKKYYNNGNGLLFTRILK